MKCRFWGKADNTPMSSITLFDQKRQRRTVRSISALGVTRRCVTPLGTLWDGDGEPERGCGQMDSLRQNIGAKFRCSKGRGIIIRVSAVQIRPPLPKNQALSCTGFPFLLSFCSPVKEAPSPKATEQLQPGAGHVWPAESVAVTQQIRSLSGEKRTRRCAQRKFSAR